MPEHPAATDTNPTQKQPPGAGEKEDCLQAKLHDTLTDAELAELVLGSGRAIKRPGARRILTASLLWLLSLVLYVTHPALEPLNDILGLATLGLVCVIFGWYFADYTGPAWLLGGRAFQRIDKTTPPVLISFFGWVLLVFAPAVFAVVIVVP